MDAINWRQTKKTSVRAFLLRQILKINFRFWVGRTEVDIALLRKRERMATRFVPGLPGTVQESRVVAGAAQLAYLRSPNVLENRVILYLHGGGYIGCSAFGTHRDHIWRVGKACQAVVAALEYRKAPETPYPGALEDAVAAYQLLLDKFVPGSISVMGDSAGGGLAMALVLKLRDQGLPLPSSVVAFSPWADLTNSGASVVENRDSERMVPAHLLNEIAAIYIGESDAVNPYISPYYGDFSGFPPSLLFASDIEVLRDDALRVAEKMRHSGVKVMMQLWHKLPHVWPMFARTVPEARAALAMTAMFVESHWQ